MTNWKTTVNGILALFLTILLAVLSYQIPTALLSPQADHTWLIITAVCTLLSGVIRAVIGFLQNDAPPPSALAASISAASNAPIDVATVAKKLTPLILLCLWIPLFAVSGCKLQTAPLPPGALSPADASADEILSAATAAVNQYEADVKSGFTPAPALKATMSDIQQQLAIAIPAYKTWHAALETAPATPQPAALTSAVATIKIKIEALPSATK